MYVTKNVQEEISISHCLKYYLCHILRHIICPLQKESLKLHLVQIVSRHRLKES